jgi:hypothetical protein
VDYILVELLWIEQLGSRSLGWQQLELARQRQRLRTSTICAGLGAPAPELPAGAAVVRTRLICPRSWNRRLSPDRPEEALDLLADTKQDFHLGRLWLPHLVEQVL